jgi:hypothetical protein
LLEAEATADSARRQLDALEISVRGIDLPFEVQSAARNLRVWEARLALRAEIARRVQEIRLYPKSEKGNFEICIQFRNKVFRYVTC